jgi:hypothetical protein
MQMSGQPGIRQQFVRKLEALLLKLAVLQLQLFDLLILAHLTISWLAVFRLLVGRFRRFGSWFLVQLLIDHWFLGEPWFLAGARIEPGAAGLSVVARFVPQVLNRA